jgi:hypothetical protein
LLQPFRWRLWFRLRFRFRFRFRFGSRRSRRLSSLTLQYYGHLLDLTDNSCFFQVKHVFLGLVQADVLFEHKRFTGK